MTDDDTPATGNRVIELLEQIAENVIPSGKPLPLVLTTQAAAAFVGMGRSLFYQHRHDANFPRPVEVPGKDAPLWRRSDLEAWVKNRPLRKKPIKSIKDTNLRNRVTGRQRKSHESPTPTQPTEASSTETPPLLA